MSSFSKCIIKRRSHSYGLVRNSNEMEIDILDIIISENFTKIKFIHSDLTNCRFKIGNKFL